MNIAGALRSLNIDTEFAETHALLGTIVIAPSAEYPRRNRRGSLINGRVERAVVHCSHDVFPRVRDIVRARDEIERERL